MKFLKIIFFFSLKPSGDKCGIFLYSTDVEYLYPVLAAKAAVTAPRG